MAGKLENLSKENNMEKKCWTCEHAKEVECDPSMKEWMKDFISCTKDKVSVNCNKMYTCHCHKLNNNIIISEPTPELKAKWEKFQLKDNKND